MRICRTGLWSLLAKTTELGPVPVSTDQLVIRPRYTGVPNCAWGASTGKVGRCRARKKPTERLSQEARPYEGRTRIENGAADLYRQVDAQGSVFAERQTLPTWAVAPPPGKGLSADADPELFAILNLQD